MSEPTCKRCGGHVIVVLKRAWCMRRYVDGGCGYDFIQRDGRWMPAPWMRVVNRFAECLSQDVQSAK